MGHRVVRIKPKGARTPDRLVVELDPEPEEPLELAVDIIARAALGTGDVLDAERLWELRLLDERHRCRQRAWALLARRPRSRKELERALRQRKFHPRAVEDVLERLDSMGHVDDQAFAKLLVDQRVARKKDGPRKVRQDLAEKGVAREIIEEAIAPAADRDHQREAALALARKWNRRSKPEDLTKRKAAAAGFLARRGFELDIVFDVVNQVVGAPQEDEAGEPFAPEDLF